MEQIRFIIKIILISCLLSQLFFCGSHIQDEEANTTNQLQQQAIKKLKPAPQSVKSLLKCIEYFDKLKHAIQQEVKSDNMLAFEKREFVKAYIEPILEESENTNVYELNTLYPELGKYFYSQLIVGLRMALKMAENYKSNTEKITDGSKDSFWGSLGLWSNRDELLKEGINFENRSNVLLLNWTEWLANNGEKINQIIKTSYEIEGIIKIGNNFSDYLARGEEYLRTKAYPEAISAFTKAIKANSNSPEAYKLRGFTHLQMNQSDEALSDYSRSITLNPKDFEALYQRGTIYHNQKKYDLAVNDYTNAISLKPDYAIACLNRSYIYLFIQEKFDLAKKDLDTIIDLNPKNVQAYLFRALAHHKLQKYDQGIHDINNAIEIEPGKAELYCARGILLQDMKQYENAIRDYNQAISLNFKDKEAYLNRALLFFKMKNYRSSKSDYKMVIALEPANTLAYFNLACINSIENDLNSALEMLTKCFQLDKKYLDTAEEDDDLVNVRNDSRYKEIVKVYKGNKKV